MRQPEGVLAFVNNAIIPLKASEYRYTFRVRFSLVRRAPMGNGLF